MRPKIQKLYSPVTLSDVTVIENNLGITLPEEYKSFIIETNGGEPTPHIVKTINDGKEVVGWFFGIHGKSSNLLSMHKQYSRYLPKGALPIASDPFGNFFCIAVDKNSYGKIFLWQHEDMPQTHLAIGDSNCTLVAPSFEHFINSFIND